MDATKFAPCGALDKTVTDSFENEKSGGGAGTCVQGSYDDGSIFDVLFVYTGNALSAVGGSSAMEALLNLVVDEANTYLENSDVEQRLNLVFRHEVDYDEGSTRQEFLSALSALQSKGDGNMDEVHDIRGYYLVPVAERLNLQIVLSR